MPEQFDFSKIEDQQKFESLPEVEGFTEEMRNEATIESIQKQKSIDLETIKRSNEQGDQQKLQELREQLKNIKPNSEILEMSDPDFLTDREKFQEEEKIGQMAGKFFPEEEVKGRTEAILDRFGAGNLLAHTASLEQIDSLFDSLNKDGEIRNLSTSLLAEGGKNSLYGSGRIGLFLDGQAVKLEHISKADSSSSGQGEDFHASDHARVESLRELADYLRSSEATSINEVNITFDSPKAILGILCKNSVGDKIDGSIMYIKSKRRLPIFVLAEKPEAKNNGLPVLEEWKPSKTEVAQLINNYPVKKAREKYEKILKYLD